MAVQFQDVFAQNPLALALALKSKEAGAESSSDMEREMAKMYYKQLSSGVGDTSPIQSHWQGAARLANGLFSGMVRNQAISADKANNAAIGNVLFGGLGGGGAAPASAPPTAMPMPAPEVPSVPDMPPMAAPVPEPQAAAPGNNQAMIAALMGGPPSGEMPTLAPKPEGPGLLSANPPSTHEIINQAKGAIAPTPMPRPRPANMPMMATPTPRPAPQMASAPPQVMASDGMPAPRPPGMIPNAPGALPQQYVDAIKKFEGYAPKASWDYKQHSVGYGTRAKHAGETIDRAEAERRLAAELQRAAGIVDKFKPGLPEGPRAALTSLTYNSGDKWTRSGLGQLVQSGDMEAAKNRLLAYNKAGGQVLPGLASRRQAEAQWFGGAPRRQAGQPMQGPIPLPRPRPPGAPQMPQEQMPPQQPNPEMSNARVQLASLGGNTASDASPLPRQAPAPAPQMQMAQAQPQGQPRTQPQVPPHVLNKARQLWGMGSQGRQLATELIKPYLKPMEAKPVDLGNEVGFVDSTGNIIRREKKMQDTDDIREYRMYEQQARAAGQQPMSFMDFQTAVKRSGASQNNVSIDQRAPTEFEKEYGQGMGKRALSIIDAGDKAASELQRTQLLKNILGSIKSGKLAPAGATMGAWLQSFGINPAGLGIDPNMPATAEAATAMINKEVLGNIGAGVDGGIPANNFSNADREFIVKTAPSLANRPEANEILLSIKERQHMLSMERADRWSDAREKGKSYEAFEREWRKELRSRNVFGDLQEQLKGLATPQSGTAGPQPGQVQDGYRFRGGNPGDPNSWERVQ